FLHGDRSHDDFPLAGPDRTVWNFQDTPELEHYIHVQHTAQLSREWIAEFLDDEIAAADLFAGYGVHVRDKLERALGRSDHPMVSMLYGGRGHTVVAYDVEDDPTDPTAFFIDIWDSNVPFLPEENGDDPALEDEHRDREGYADPTGDFKGRIRVGLNGDWTYI